MTSSILCFDIGGTSIRAAVTSTGHSFSAVIRYDTPVHDQEAFLTQLETIFLSLQEKPASIAISLAGVINPETGRMIVANIPAIHGTNLARDLETRIGIPVVIANDADCFAVAEAKRGAGQDHDIVFGIILGTGVGGGLVAGGKLINAKGGFAGEWGHAPVVPFRAGTPPMNIPHFSCGCGLSGCLDTVAGARGIERLYAYLNDHEKASHTIIENWREGAPQAQRTIDVYLDLIASPLALTVNLTGATVVPAGGGLARAQDLVEAIDKAVRPLTLCTFSRPLVVPALSGEEPGLTGGALIAFQYLADRLSQPR